MRKQTHLEGPQKDETAWRHHLQHAAASLYVSPVLLQDLHTQSRHTKRLESTTKVLAKRMRNYYTISECSAAHSAAFGSPVNPALPVNF